jgi:hypothetical protein
VSGIPRLSFLRFSAFIVALCLSITIAAPVIALGSHSHFVLNRFVYDPTNSGFASANFVNIDGFTALRMALTGNVAYPPGIACGAHILNGLTSEPLPNITLSQLAFDITTDSQNQGGAPRFNIYDNHGNYWLMTCLECQNAGTTTPVSNGHGTGEWINITCNPANIPELSNGATPGLPFTNNTVVTRIDILFDVIAGPGFANMANISLNGDPPCAPHLIPVSSN